MLTTLRLAVGVLMLVCGLSVTAEGQTVTPQTEADIALRRRVGQGMGEPIYTAADLYDRCAGTSADRQLCFAYIRGFSDGHIWLLRDSPAASLSLAGFAVCVPNSEAIGVAADLVVARFRDRAAELSPLSPYRALSMSLSQRYPCRQ